MECPLSTSYKCNTTIPSTYDIKGGTQNNSTWDRCKAFCEADMSCQGWTLNTKNVCQKKSQYKPQYQKDYRSGQRWNASNKAVVVYEPAPMDCSPSAAGEYKCNATISSTNNLGSAANQESWQECRKMCDADAKCAGWTYNANKSCQKKTKYETMYQQGYVSGPASARAPQGAASPPSSSSSDNKKDSPSTDTAAASTNTTTTNTQKDTNTASDSKTDTSSTTTPTTTSTSWWKKKGLLDLENWIIVLAVSLLVIMCLSSGFAVMMKSMTPSI